MFNLLFITWLKEKENEDLQKLPENFYGELADFIGEIKREGKMLNRDSVRAKLIQKELQVTKKLVEELYALRFEKILNRAMSPKPSDKLNTSLKEKRALSSLESLLEELRSSLEATLLGKAARLGEENLRKKVILVRFLKDVPAIVGADLKTYGPFVAEDVAALPIENSRVLVAHGVAAKVEHT
jgi:DNA replication factor GINS